MMRTLFADGHSAFRVLRRTPGFTLAVVFVLALGIGANTAVFSIINAVLLRPLPFAESDRLVRLFHIPPPAAFPGMPTFPVSPANFYDWQARAELFEAMAIYRFRGFTLGGDTPEAIVAGAMGAGFFDIVRTPPALGRVFRPDEDVPGRSHVAIISDGFWKRRFGGASDVIGRSLRLNGEPYEIIGVMPPEFSVKAWGGSSRDVFVPLAYTSEQRNLRENHNALVVARLKPGVTLSQATAELAAISAQLEQEYPKDNSGWGATVIPLQELIVGDIRLSLMMLLAAVGLVLLIACANVGNLLFARGLARRKELAIRAALGAGRRRVFQQLLLEAVILGCAGGVLGLAIARIGRDAGVAALASQVPRADEITLDGRVLLFVLATSILSGIVAGVLPALRAGRRNLADALREGGRGDAAVGVRTRRWLVSAEIALSVVVVMGAAVMVRTVVALRGVEAGFNANGVLTMRVSLPAQRYPTAEKRLAFFISALDRMRAVPGVRAAGAVDDLPTTGGSVQPIVREGQAELLPRDQPTVEVRQITPDYFRAMQIPILRGRDVSLSDGETMLISESAARQIWRDADPIGTRVTLPLMSRTLFREVIGIVGDVKHGQLSEPAAPTVYHLSRESGWDALAIALRTAVPPETLAKPAADIVRALDPEQPVEQVRTMDEVLDEGVTSQRFTATLLGLFAAMALALAAVGVYGVLSHVVRGRTQEIGIRAALGANPREVLRLVLIEGMTPALIGIAVGTAAALAAAGLLKRLVFGVSASDPLTLAGVALMLALVALAASLIPAYRATRVDPLKALRTP